MIVCTHNPRTDYFDRCVAALMGQTLAPERWELLVVDNVCAPEIASSLDLSWHARARIVREETLGLTPARLRGIQEASAALLVFVDDDNVPAPDYLEVALRVAVGEAVPRILERRL